jgi:metal-dependent amidase/aminoacylase/carboxypeptidase family protein
MGIDVASWKARIRTAVGELREELIAASHDIHTNPELAFQEHRATARLTEALERGGLRVDRGIGNLAQ